MGRNKQIRQSAAVSAALMVLLFLLPLAVIVPFREELVVREEYVDERGDEPVLPGETDDSVLLRVLEGETVVEMTLGEYLPGVVRAEMPASFEPEALKAQAAAARTYTMYRIASGGSHGDTAHVCTDHTCCQAYMDKETARRNWGDRAEEYENKIAAAVRDTDGQLILYGDEPVLAVFHAASAGQTRPAGEVWQSDLPYLQAVGSPEGEKAPPDYYSRAEFSTKALREKLLAAFPEAELSGPAEEWLQKAAVDEAGSVRTVEVGGVTVKGTAVRAALELRSACFTWEVKKDTVVFFVTGYGHGVGMSQYGANAMALAGADWREILTHYYTGVTVGPWRGLNNFTNRREP